MIHTQYSCYSLKEFLSVLEPKEGKSPIIDECIRRFTVMSGECPICEANLTELNKEK